MFVSWFMCDVYLIWYLDSWIAENYVSSWWCNQRLENKSIFPTKRKLHGSVLEFSHSSIALWRSMVVLFNHKEAWVFSFNSNNLVLKMKYCSIESLVTSREVSLYFKKGFQLRFSQLRGFLENKQSFCLENMLSWSYILKLFYTYF